MSEMLLELSIAYVFLTALLLLSLIYSRLHWLLKTGLLVLALGFFWVSYQGWKDTQGWPSETHLPDKFLLHFSVIEEPDEEIGQEGNIYIWVTDLSERKLADEPRAYRLPYERDLHSKISEAMRKSGNESLQIGELNAVKKLEKMSDKQNRIGQKYPGLEFKKLPAPALPEK